MVIRLLNVRWGISTLMDFDGLGVEKDISKAIYWTKRAADHGDRDGQYNLAWFYEEGIGVEIDIEKAQYWYKEAALQGHDLAIVKCRDFGIDAG